MRRVIRSEVEGRHDLAREREYQRKYAQRHGYFWLPCPLCDKDFGGHEASGSIPTEEPGRSTTICPRCTAERQGLAEDTLRRLDVEPQRITIGRWGGDTAKHSVPYR